MMFVRLEMEGTVGARAVNGLEKDMSAKIGENF